MLFVAHSTAGRVENTRGSAQAERAGALAGFNPSKAWFDASAGLQAVQTTAQASWDAGTLWGVEFWSRVRVSRSKRARWFITWKALGPPYNKWGRCGLVTEQEDHTPELGKSSD